MLKIVCWPQDNKICLLFVFHHLLADGRAALSLVNEFADYYVNGTMPSRAEETLISSVNDFPRDSKLPFVSRILVDYTDKIIIASDLRKRLSCYSSGALGNYSTAFSVNFKKKDCDTIIAAKEVHKLVQKIMKTPASLYLILQCYARLDPSLIANAVFIPPASPAIKKTKGILTVNGRMNICVSER